MNDLVAGVISGIIGSVVEYPFDTVKTLMQTYHTPHYRTFWSTIKHTLTTDGPTGFYQGFPARMLAAAVESACIFTAYKATLRSIGADVDEPLLWQIGVGGCGAGTAATLCFTPLELIKCAMQADRTDGRRHRGGGLGGREPTAQPSPSSRVRRAPHTHSSRQFRGIWDCCTQIYRGDVYRCERANRAGLVGAPVPVSGVRAFYRGGRAMFLREVPGTAVWCGTYDKLRGAMTPAGQSPRDLPVWKLMLAGG